VKVINRPQAISTELFSSTDHSRKASQTESKIYFGITSYTKMFWLSIRAMMNVSYLGGSLMAHV